MRGHRPHRGSIRNLCLAHSVLDWLIPIFDREQVEMRPVDKDGAAFAGRPIREGDRRIGQRDELRVYLT